MRSFGLAVTQLNAKLSLLALLDEINPVLNTSGCRVKPVFGLTGESWRIESAQINWLAREQSEHKNQLGVSRQREANILKKLSYLGISPSVIMCNVRWLIVDWIEGDVVTENQFVELVDNAVLAGFFTQLHRLPLTGYPINLPARLVSYWHYIDRRRVSARWLRLHQFFQQTSQPQGIKLAVAHMDIHSGNIIQTMKGIQFIDWEYAGDVDIALDIAMLFCSNNWGWQQQEYFLQQYCSHPQGYKGIKRLTCQIQRWLPWVNYLMLMWFEVRWQQTEQPEFIILAKPLRQYFNL